MDVPSSPIDTRDIDRALDRRRGSFGFRGAIESLYRSDAIAEQKGSVALNMVAFVCLFDSFAINDYVMLRDSIVSFLIGKFLVVTPVCLVGAVVASRSAKLYQWALWTYAVTMAGTLSAMLCWSQGGYRTYYLFGVLLIMVGTVALTRPRLPTAMASILVQCACFEFVVFASDIVPSDGRIVASLFCMSAAVIATLTAYALESVNRRAFLLKLRVQLLNRDLQAMTLLDPLTGLGNRRALQEATLRHWAGDARAPRWVSMILIDIDFFKVFNDSYGHPAGDVCLERIARAVVSETREGRDLAVRFGGEEIAVFLPDTDLTEARTIAEAIRHAILASAIPHPAVAPDAVVTASLGVASSLTAGCTANELVKYTDIALYAAKQNGRNMVWSSPAGAASPVPAIESLAA